MNTGETIGHNTTELFNGAAILLNYGPIGLAALMLVLTAAALAWGDLTAIKARIITVFMTFGFLAFIAALLAPLIAPTPKIHIVVYPHDIEAFKNLPRPTITINQVKQDAPFSFPIKTDAYATIDVSQTVNFADVLSRQNIQKTALISAYSDVVEKAKDAAGKALTASQAITCVTPTAPYTASRPTGLDEVFSVTSESISKLSALQFELSDANIAIEKSLPSKEYPLSDFGGLIGGKWAMNDEKWKNDSGWPDPNIKELLAEGNSSSPAN